MDLNVFRVAIQYFWASNVQSQEIPPTPLKKGGEKRPFFRGDKALTQRCWVAILLMQSLRYASILLLIVGCTKKPPTEAPREIKLYQNWELQPGQVVGGYAVVSGLGDLSIALKGDAVYAPFDGRVQPHNSSCVIFSSEEIPVYLFRLCGLRSLNFGFLSAGDAIGSGKELQIAVLTRQPDGRWALVEPSKKIIEQMLLR